MHLHVSARPHAAARRRPRLAEAVGLVGLVAGDDRVGREREELPQRSVAELGDPLLARSDDARGQVALLLEHRVHLLLDSASGEQLVHLHRPLLPDPVGAVGRLVLDRRVPPAVEVEDVTRGSEVESRPACLYREHEHLRPAGVVLEPPHHGIARRARDPAVEEWHLDAERARERGDEPVAHLAELREDERPVARGHNLLEHLAEACELARAAGERACLAQVVRRVVADLLERRDERQDQATPLDAVRGLDSSHRLLHRCLVERGLLARERADDLHLLLGREVPYDPRVALHAAQDEWPDDSPEALRDVVAPVAFDGDSDLAPEAFERSKEPRIQVLRDRPQLGQPVLDRRAGECDAETGAESTGGPGGARGGVLDVLRLVESRHRPVDGAQDFRVAAEEAVGGDDQRAGRRPLELRRRTGAARAVVAHDGQRGREAGDLALPVADHRGRAHEKRITPVLGTRRAAVEQEGEELDRLPEPHVVGETGAEAEVGHPGEPGKPPLLIGAERAAEIPGDGDAVRAEPPAQPGNYARELPLGDDVDGQPRLRPPRRLPERHRVSSAGRMTPMPASASAGAASVRNAQASPGSSRTASGRASRRLRSMGGKSRAPVARARSRCSPAAWNARPRWRTASPRPRKTSRAGTRRLGSSAAWRKNRRGKVSAARPRRGGWVPSASGRSSRKHARAIPGSAPTAGRAQASSSASSIRSWNPAGAKSASGAANAATRRRSHGTWASGRPLARIGSAGAAAARTSASAVASRKARRSAAGAHTSVARGRPCLRPPLTRFTSTSPGTAWAASGRTFTSAATRSASSASASATAHRG